MWDERTGTAQVPHAHHVRPLRPRVYATVMHTEPTLDYMTPASRYGDG